MIMLQIQRISHQNIRYIVRVPPEHEKNTNQKNWKDVIEHRKKILLEGIEIFNDFLVVIERDSGLVKMNVRKWDNGQNYYLPIEGETYSLSIGTNIDFKSTKLRYNFSSLNTPSSVIDFDMETKLFDVKKKQEVVDDNFNDVKDKIHASKN